MGDIRSVNVEAASAEWIPTHIATPFVPKSLVELLQATPAEVSRCDIALMNLLCADGLPGAEEMSIPKYLARIDQMAEFIRTKTAQELPYFRADPARAGLPPETPEDFFRICSLIRIIKDNFGLHYERDLVEARREKTSTLLGYLDSKLLLINGLLSEKRHGTCQSIPVMVVALGRRLGYPLFLSANRCHVWARWEGNGRRFNIDASCPGNSFGNDFDDHYRTFPEPWPEVDTCSGYYLKNFTPADELALFLWSRAWVLTCHHRFEESIPYWAKACFLAPAEPQYPFRAMDAVYEAAFLKQKGRLAKWGGKIAKRRRPKESMADFDFREVFPPRVAAQAVSIHAHMYEVAQQFGRAMLYYRAARDAEEDNPDYQADFERCRNEVQECVVASHIRADKLAREQHPDVFRPPIEESTKRLRESFTQPSKPSDPQHMLKLMQGARFAKSQRHLLIGRKAMDAGRWEESQAEFVRAWKMADDNGKPACAAYLMTALRKELLDIAPLRPEPRPAELPRPDIDEDDDEPQPGPLAKVPLPLQGVVWFKRALVLADLGRCVEAIEALEEGSRLASDWSEGAQHREKVAAVVAKRKAEEDRRFPLKDDGVLVPTPKVYVTTVDVGFATRDGTHLPPVVIPPRYYPRPNNGRL